MRKVMAERVRLLGPDGRPIDLSALKRDVAAPDGTGVRQIVGGHPAQGLTPSRLASLLREAEQGDPLRYLELAEEMEEKDLHYLGVLGARKRAVSGLEVTVEAASDAADDVRNADLVRRALDRDELQDELFDMLDAIGKGFSFTEIVWDTAGRGAGGGGEWLPARFEWRDPRWFRFDPIDGATPLLREVGGDAPLPPYKFVVHRAKAKSGLALRGGLARAAAWSYLFKNYDVKDWVGFAETYGQPLRIGKYPPASGEADKAVLRRALANLGSDWAAMIPEGMLIELIEAKREGSVDLFERLADWLDRQVSKAVLGQTATTDAIAGGHAVGRVHDEVRTDIRKADCVALGATLTRDVALPIVALNFGPQKAWPKIRILPPEAVDVERLSNALVRLVPMGLKVEQSVIRDKLGLPDPDEGAELLTAPVLRQAQDEALPEDDERRPPPRRAAAAAAERDDDILDDLAREALDDAGFAAFAPALQPLLDLVGEVGSLEELRDRLPALLPQMPVEAMTAALAQAMFAAHAAGRLEIETSEADEAGGA